MEPSPELNYATSTSSTVATATLDKVQPSTVMERFSNCNCSVLSRLETIQKNNLDWRMDELVRIPASAHGYIDPQSGKQVGSFITYVINFCESSVRRRYSDFEYLHSHFCRIYPYSIIPPIPGKQSINVSIGAIFGGGTSRGGGGGGGGGEPSSSLSSLSSSSAYLVSYRVRAFCQFLRNLLTHSVLYADHALHLFLTNPDSSWKSIVMSFKVVNVKSFSGKEQPKTLEKSFDQVISILSMFEESCKSLELSQKMILRKLQDTLNILELLGTAYNSFSLEFAQLSEVLDVIGEIHDGNAASFSDILLAQQSICESIDEVGLYIGSIKRALRNYSWRLIEYESLCESINQLGREILQKDDDHGKTIKPCPSLDQDLPKLEESEREVALELEILKKSLWDQLAIWMIRLRFTFNTLLVSLASSEKSFANQGIQSWKKGFPSPPSNEKALNYH